MTGTLSHTYVAALRHGLASVPEGATLVGVARRPTGWFSAAVDENHPELGPPADLLDRVHDRREDLQLAGLCEEGAHNAAFEEVDFEGRYREHLESAAADAAVRNLLERLRGGEDLALVCFENTAKKRCHRTILLDHLAERADVTVENGAATG